MTTEIQHRFVETNGIRMHIAEAGEGPLVVLCHGFPESWYSWRHQIRALAEAGYHVVAPDQRGYGQTDAPEDAASYTQLHLVGDIVGLLDALGEETAVVAGHDWGAPVAWNAALMRPDRFPAVIALSVPYTPRGAIKPTDAMKAMAGDNFFYILYFQEPGKAEAELEADVRRTLRMFNYSASGDPELGTYFRRMPKDRTFLEWCGDPGEDWHTWLAPEELDFYVGEFERAGFRGGLNWYRNVDRTWELMAAFDGAKVRVPALFIAGDRDGVVAANPQAVTNLATHVPDLRETVMLPGCGHWTQQERPQEVTGAMLRFLESVSGAR
ncbi:MAG: alpha/beta hydrolase [Dehalococcoidia bacterium]|nr:alpha/beta hydrolase [Dehalococcoidia bacterium]